MKTRRCSCWIFLFWEISKAVEYETLDLTLPPLDWMQSALKKEHHGSGHHARNCRPILQLAVQGLKTEDPADQLIVATAMVHRLTLVTRDHLISKWGGVPVLNY